MQKRRGAFSRGLHCRLTQGQGYERGFHQTLSVDSQDVIEVLLCEVPQESQEV